MALVKIIYAMVGAAVLSFALVNAIAMMWSPEKLRSLIGWYTGNPEWRFPWSVRAAELRLAGFFVGATATFLLMQLVSKVAALHR